MHAHAHVHVMCTCMCTACACACAWRVHVQGTCRACTCCTGGDAANLRARSTCAGLSRPSKCTYEEEPRPTRLHIGRWARAELTMRVPRGTSTALRGAVSWWSAKAARLRGVGVSAGAKRRPFFVSTKTTLEGAPTSAAPKECQAEGAIAGVGRYAATKREASTH